MIFSSLSNMPQFITSLAITLLGFAKTFEKLKKILESESECAIDWFTTNGIFVNPDQFKAFVIDKKRTNCTNEKIQISNEDIQIVPSVKLLGNYN